jgi:hypothetical protein
MLFALLMSECASRANESVQHDAGLLKLDQSRCSLVDVALLFLKQSLSFFALFLIAVSLTVSLLELLFDLSDLCLLVSI